MKKILFVCLMAALGLGTGSAAAKDAKKASTVTTVFKTDIDCEHCANVLVDIVLFHRAVHHQIAVILFDVAQRCHAASASSQIFLRIFSNL